MALAWNAGWVNALAGSNPASSATRKAPSLRLSMTGPFVCFMYLHEVSVWATHALFCFFHAHEVGEEGA